MGPTLAWCRCPAQKLPWLEPNVNSPRSRLCAVWDLLTCALRPLAKICKSAEIILFYPSAITLVLDAWHFGRAARRAPSLGFRPWESCQFKIHSYIHTGTNKATFIPPTAFLQLDTWPPFLHSFFDKAAFNITSMTNKLNVKFLAQHTCKTQANLESFSFLLWKAFSFHRNS